MIHFVLSKTIEMLNVSFKKAYKSFGENDNLKENQFL